MGACEYVKEFVTDDIHKKIDEVVDSITKHYYDIDELSYSGDINTIHFKREYFKSFKTKEEKDKYIEDRLRVLEKREGEIVDLGVEYFVKAYVDFKESDVKFFKNKTNINNSYLEFLKSKFSSDKKYLLVDETGSYYSSYSTLEEAKSYVNNRILKEVFKTDYFILSKSCIIFCTGVGDIYDKYINSGKGYLVIPYNRYLLIGLAAE